MNFLHGLVTDKRCHYRVLLIEKIRGGVIVEFWEVSLLVVKIGVIIKFAEVSMLCYLLRLRDLSLLRHSQKNIFVQIFIKK